MDLIVNGKKMIFQENISIKDLLDKLDIEDKFIVVEVNGEIIGRESYNNILHEGSKIEIVSFVGGG